ncbi:MMPL family transporter [Streptomyces mirabilis]|uniref:MMPL family transporter n=1 Tax=Streptomyces mirabilis TaxID=68239 RepID=UPI00225555D8|nr:MMPL family transporter [Streptomyces mirabilis]MCX4431536.1 MMPL family transporter [Streptomyces mirabilis]
MSVFLPSCAGRTLTAPSAEAGLAKAAGISGVVQVTDPFRTKDLSADRRIGYADVRFRQAAADVTRESKDALSRAMAQARDAGLRVEYGGSAMKAATKVGGPAELVGVVIAFAVLALTLGSLVAAGCR